MPLTITESKISSTEDKVKITLHTANTGNDHTTQKGIIEDLGVNSQKEIINDLEVNSYQEVILNKINKNKEQTPMEEWSILSGHVKYVTHGESEVFQKA